MSTAFLFPGQGSQTAGMLHNLPEHKKIQETLDEAESIIGHILSLDSKEALQKTRAVQLSLLVSGVALARAMMSEGAKPNMVAGHSVGSFSAAVISGALDFKDALSLVSLRGKLMENTFPSGYGMGAVIGFDENTISELIGKIYRTSSPIYIANLNTKDQITVAGSISAIKELFELALLKGARKVKLLNVSVPSHCELLNSISLELTKKMETMNFKPCVIPYVGNCRGRVLRNPEDIRKDLSMGIANAVRWYDATTLMYEYGVRLFIEAGPGQVLTNMINNEHADSRALSIGDNGFQSAVILTKRENNEYY